MCNMSYPFSDSDTSDSDTGIRFKTESTRKTVEQYSERKREPAKHERDYYSKRPNSSHRKYDRSRDRSRSKERERRRKYDNSSHRKHGSNSSEDKKSRNNRCYEREHPRPSSPRKYFSASPVTQCKAIHSDDNFESIKSSSSIKKLTKHEDLKPSLKESNISFGPSLPPQVPQSNENEEPETSSRNLYGPVLPPIVSNKSEIYGPNSLNLTDKREQESEEDETSEEEDDNFRPTPPLPDDTLSEKAKEENEQIGPALPTHLQRQKESTSSSVCDEPDNSVIGPVLPAHLREKLLQQAESSEPMHQGELGSESESDDEVYGPLPPGHEKNSASHMQLEERALQMKIESLNPSNTDETVREEWMLELPQVHVPNLGLGPRQFRAKEGPDMSDRSSWTDTPQDKLKKTAQPAKKVDLKKEAELKQIQERDKEQEKMVKEHKKKKKRDKSLLDMHQEKIKKKKKDSKNKITERRPFDRDIDLKIHRFDEAQKKAIFKKAQMLDSRFSSGESKFL